MPKAFLFKEHPTPKGRSVLSEVQVLASLQREDPITTQLTSARLRPLAARGGFVEVYQYVCFMPHGVMALYRVDNFQPELQVVSRADQKTHSLRQHVAYLISNRLGLNLVPPSVPRSLTSLGMGSVTACLDAVQMFGRPEEAKSASGPASVRNPGSLGIVLAFDLLIGSGQWMFESYVRDALKTVRSIEHHDAFTYTETARLEAVIRHDPFIPKEDWIALEQGWKSDARQYIQSDLERYLGPDVQLMFLTYWQTLLDTQKIGKHAITIL